MRLLHLPVAGVIVTLPLLMLFGLLRLAAGASLADYAPVWSDEVYYWQQARAFGEVGLESGYFTYTERPPPAGIGLSFVSDTREPPKSQYLVFTDNFYERHRDELHVERLIDVPRGALYRNLASACPAAD